MCLSEEIVCNFDQQISPFLNFEVTEFSASIFLKSISSMLSKIQKYQIFHCNLVVN